MDFIIPIGRHGASSPTKAHVAPSPPIPPQATYHHILFTNSPINKKPRCPIQNFQEIMESPVRLLATRTHDACMVSLPSTLCLCDFARRACLCLATTDPNRHTSHRCSARDDDAQPPPTGDRCLATSDGQPDVACSRQLAPPRLLLLGASASRAAIAATASRPVRPSLLDW